MKHGKKRFEYYLDKSESILKQAANDVNPALWLYGNNARTTFFMLEGLSKLYAGLHNENKFDKIKDQVKLLEDGIGMIDFYDNVGKDLQKKEGIPEFIISYMQAQTREKMQRLNEILKEKRWISEDAERINKIRSKLKKADWLEPKKELTSILNFYLDSIREIKLFIPEKFTEMEAQVHSLRRKLRWLSIYPQALQGAIQLNENGQPDNTTEKYLTPEIRESVFNKMPEKADNEYVLMLEKKYFLSLSWMIADIGKIKDEGLNILAVAEAFQQIKGLNHDDALHETFGLLGIENDSLEKLLNRTTIICQSFFAEGHLDKLIYGIYPKK